MVLTADLRVQTANEAFYRTFRLSPAETDNHSIFELDHGSWNIPKLRGLLDDIIPRKSFFNDFEVTHDFARIGQRSMLVNARTLLQAAGKTKLVLLSIRDITERQQADRAVRESEARFRTLAESAPALIWVNDLNGSEYVNRQYLEFLGVSVADVRGYDWAQFIHPDDRDSYVASYMQAMDQRTVFDAEFRFRRYDGEYRWMRSVGQPRFGATDDLLGYAGLTVDVTEHRQAAEQLRQSHEKLRSYADDLQRFNRVAVGRETRMIELKNEINELARRLGEPRRYPLEFEQKATTDE